MGYKNKEDQSKCAKKHYLNNKKIYKARAKLFNIQVRKRNRDYVDSYLKNNPCVDCGNSNIIVLEFDHIIGNKISDISIALSKLCWSIKKLQIEIDKCEIRCANCHRIATYNRRNNKIK